jgi:hypothetical protein
MATGTVSAMIQRFREAKPMSRAERSALNSTPSHMWWESDDIIDSKEVTNETEQLVERPRSYALQPASKSVIPNHSYNDEIVGSFQQSFNLDDLIEKEIDSLAREMRADNSRNRVEVNNSKVSGANDYRQNKSTTRKESLPDIDDWLSENLAEDLDDYTEFGSYFANRRNKSATIDLNEILHSSVDTLGSTGLRSLLLPGLKFDGNGVIPYSSRTLK